MSTRIRQQFFSSVSLQRLPRASFKIFQLLLVVLILVNSRANAFKTDSQHVEPETPTVSSNETTQSSFQSGSVTFSCKDLRVYDQRKLCLNTTGLKEVLIQTEAYAREECEFHFRNHKWRCYGFSVFSKSNITKKACKESSFVYSLISAILTRTIASACSEEQMNCTRSTDGPELQSPDNTTKAQQINFQAQYILFAMEMTQRFLDSAELKKKSINDRQRLNLHNNNVGRQVVHDNIVEVCKCHGLSGGCTLRKCTKTLPSLREVSSLLVVEKYNKARRVIPSRDSMNFIPYDSSEVAVKPGDLIYLDKSPDFCFRDISIGSPGVTGLECDGHVRRGSNSCSSRCCDRGFIEKEVEVEVEHGCCKFIWCCSIRCTKCTKKVTLHFCK